MLTELVAVSKSFVMAYTYAASGQDEQKLINFEDFWLRVTGSDLKQIV